MQNKNFLKKERKNKEGKREKERKKEQRKKRKKERKNTITCGFCSDFGKAKLQRENLITL